MKVTLTPVPRIIVMLDEESERLTKKEVECCNLQARAIIVLARCDFVAATLTI